MPTAVAIHSFLSISPPSPPSPPPRLSIPRRSLFLAPAFPLLTPVLTLPSHSAPQSKNPFAGRIANTKAWFQFLGDGFAIRVPPLFEDVTEPDDPNSGLSLYGDKVKSKKFAARFASLDRSEILSVVIRPSNQLKITFLEAQDIADLGSLKSAARIFVPYGATLYDARTLKIREEEDVRNYYFYEFGLNDERVALMATISSGRAIVAGASAPLSLWDVDGVKLRSAALSLSIQ